MIYLFLTIFHGDHPRLCGEKLEPQVLRQFEGGSPPPMRGKGIVLLLMPLGNGITPAYAGKSCNRFRTSGSCGDHPRLCGEKPYAGKSAEPPRGSPPPMRGKDGADTKPFVSVRITPAYAGKSPESVIPRNQESDHPRLCGEKRCLRGAVNGTKGSPPPMRGKG